MTSAEPDATPAARPRVMRLPSLALIRAGGADADAFLQGQLSSDLRKLTPTGGQISSYSSPKGRMLAVFYLNRWESGLTLEVHRGVAADVLARLRRFVMRSKVTLDDVSEALPALALTGESAAARLRASGLEPPAAADGFVVDDGVAISRRRGGIPRFVIRAEPERIARLESVLAETGDVAGEEVWRREEIEAGLPCMYPGTADHFVAQMANLDLLGGVAFDKGCFAGQEVIARLHYLGTVKRRLALMRFETPDAEPGMPLFDAAHPDQPVGEIADVAADGARGWLASAVLQVPHLYSPGLHLGSAEGALSGPVRPSLGTDAEG